VDEYRLLRKVPGQAQTAFAYTTNPPSQRQSLGLPQIVACKCGRWSSSSNLETTEEARKVVANKDDHRDSEWIGSLRISSASLAQPFQEPQVIIAFQADFGQHDLDFCSYALEVGLECQVLRTSYHDLRVFGLIVSRRPRSRSEFWDRPTGRVCLLQAS